MEEDVAFWRDAIEYLALLPAHHQNSTGAHTGKMEALSVNLAAKLGPRRKRYLAGGAFTASPKDYGCSSKHLKKLQNVLKSLAYQREALNTNK